MYDDEMIEDQSKALRDPFPVYVEDWEIGAMDLALEILAGGYGLQDSPGPERLLCDAFGFSDFESLKAARQPAASTVLPDRYFTLFDIAAWRAHLHGHGALADLWMVFLQIQSAVPFMARRRFDRYEMLVQRKADNDQGAIKLNQWGPIDLGRMPAFDDQWCPEPEWLRGIDSALNEDGVLYIGDRHRIPKTMCEMMWEGEAQRSRQALANDIELHIGLPLERAITDWPDQSAVSPPGFTPVSFADEAGNLVGHGFWAAEIAGCLQWVYPVSGEEYLAAWVALWWKKPVKAPQKPPSLPSTLMLADFSAPWRRPAAFAKRKEDNPWLFDGQPVPHDGERITLGFDLEMYGTAFTRPPREYVAERFETFLLQPLCEVDADGEHWLSDVTDAAISAEAVSVVWRLQTTLDEMGQIEATRCQNNPGAYDSLVRKLLPRRLFVRTWGMELAHAEEFPLSDIRVGARRVKKAYEAVRDIPDDVLGEYAYEYFDKNGCRFADEAIGSDQSFVAYVAIRLAGVTFPVQVGGYSSMWLGLARACRLHIEQALSAPAPPKKTMLARRLQAMMDQCDVVETIEELDTTLSTPWFREPATMNADWVAYRRG